MASLRLVNVPSPSTSWSINISLTTRSIYHRSASTMSPIDQPAIPRGSTVLVIGANGFIGSNIADQFLRLGYKVRGTTRNPEKNAWVANLFGRKYGPGRFELVAVPDMEAPGAFDDAVRGVSAVVHTATNYTMSPDPDAVIPGSIAGTVNALASAAKEPGLKRFVLTSSSASALIPKPNDPVTVTVDTWNDEVVRFAQGGPPQVPESAYPVYAASKTLSEKEAWKFVREKKPGFVLNAVLPNINFGASLDLANQGHPSTSGLVVELFNGNSAALAGLPARKSFVVVVVFLGSFLSSLAFRFISADSTKMTHLHPRRETADILSTIYMHSS
jgi:NAD(P)-dependent dehydrogenase (short-subunit alcohol dehydrogenase family)